MSKLFGSDHMEISSCIELFPSALDVLGVGGRVPTERDLQKVRAELFSGLLLV